MTTATIIAELIGAGALTILCILLAATIALLAMAASANAQKDEQLAAWEAWAALEYGADEGGTPLVSDRQLRSALRTYKRGV